MRKELILQASKKRRRGILIYGISLILIFIIIIFQTIEGWFGILGIIGVILILIYIILDINLKKVLISKDKRYIKFVKPFKTNVILVSDIKEWCIIEEKSLFRGKMGINYITNIIRFACIFKNNNIFKFVTNFGFRKKDIEKFFNSALTEKNKKIYKTIKSGLL